MNPFSVHKPYDSPGLQYSNNPQMSGYQIPQNNTLTLILFVILTLVSLRQERPVHLHPESVYQAMRERGRAIPAAPTLPSTGRNLPIGSRPSLTPGSHSLPSTSATRIIDGKVLWICV